MINGNRGGRPDDIALAILETKAARLDDLQARYEAMHEQIAQACKSPGERIYAGQFFEQAFYFVADPAPAAESGDDAAPA